MRDTTLWQDFRAYVLHSGNTLNKLIAINVAAFILFGTFNVVLWIFGMNHEIYERIESFLLFPSSPLAFLYKPWSIITYQFMHLNLGHIFFNMLVFLFAGRIFREYLGDKKLLSVYLLGGAVGALMFMTCSNIFPNMRGSASPLIGASASIMAILVAVGTLLPRYTVYLFFLGAVRLVYIVLVLVVIDFLSIGFTNTGGSLAHLGGSLFGYVYIVLLQRGTDIGAWLTKLIDGIAGLFKKKSSVKLYSYNDVPLRAKPVRPGRISQDDVDKILDKIAQSGYESLTQREKDILFRASKED